MKLEQTPVTGKERPERLSPEMQALSGFYRALNERDIGLMERNWAQTDEVAMDDPVGGIKRGWAEIRSVYEKVFSHAGRYWFEFHDYSFHQAGDIFYVVGRERGEYSTGGKVLAMAIRTSRVFRRIEGSWRQVHHHGSIDDPELLAAYRQAVNSKT